MEKRKILREEAQPLGKHNPVQFLVKTETVSDIIKYPFDYFNPMQSSVVEVLEEDCNVIITSPTASGKTIAMELFVAQSFKDHPDECAMCLFPLKSLTEEKLGEWSDPEHSFSSKKIIPITGDHSLSEEKKEGLKTTNIVVATSEMLDSKTRNFKFNKWLERIKILVVDESHLIGAEKRGPKLESALMRFCKHFPDCRVILMSATVPNKADLLEWLEVISPKREAVLIESDYRPCELKRHYITFSDGVMSNQRHYSAIDRLRMSAVKAQISKNQDDQHLIFVGNKDFGNTLKEFLSNQGIQTEFHNADLPLKERFRIESLFKSGSLRYLISTTTTASGLNLPARRVIVSQTNFGLSPIDVWEIDQMVGRSGRPKYDKRGDAYILLPESLAEIETGRIKGGFKIVSHICDVPNLVFNAVSEIEIGNIQNKNDFYEWYKHTLAYVQGIKLSKDYCDEVFDKLEQMNMITIDEIGNYKVTQLGKIASHMYQNPYDVYFWYKNFSNIEEINCRRIPREKSDRLAILKSNEKIATSIADCYEQKINRPFASRAEKDTQNMEKYLKYSRRSPDGVAKIGACYFAMLNGDEIDFSLRSTVQQLRQDLQRTMETLKMIHVRYGKYAGKKGFRYDDSEWDFLYYRIMYGVPLEFCPLVSIPGIGKQYAAKLYQSGIRSKRDLLDNIPLSREILGDKTFDKVTKALSKT